MYGPIPLKVVFVVNRYPLPISHSLGHLQITTVLNIQAKWIVNCICLHVGCLRDHLGKGKGTPYLTSEVPLLSGEYSPRKPTVHSFYPPLSISAPF